MNKELEPQMENALDAVKKGIFKSIAKLTPSKKSAVVPPDPQVVPNPQIIPVLRVVLAPQIVLDL